ncbi:MAG: hypothetical protein ACOVOF_13770 [Chryseotalea sp.]|jgi:hypothetical protein
MAKSVNGGYILVGNLITGDQTDITVIRTDAIGNTLGQIRIKDGSAKSLVVGGDGKYYIVGDRILLDRGNEDLVEIVNTQAHIFVVEENDIVGKFDLQDFTPVEELVIRDTTDSNPNDLTVDFKGYSASVTQDSIYVLGSFKFPQSEANEIAFIAAYKLDEISPTSEASWFKTYQAFDRNFVNTNKLHLVNNKNFIWGNTYRKEFNENATSEANIFVVPKNSINTDNDQIKFSDRSYIINDLEVSPFGVGAVGTFSQPDGSNANVFFARYELYGDVGEISRVSYFDGVSKNLSETDRENSSSQDEGKAITPTKDGGFVIACVFNSTLTIGNGGKDIMLIRLNAFGEYQWSEILGGNGDEEVESIIETEDGSLLLCGTVNVNGLSSLFLVKTNAAGKLNN